MKKTDTDKLEIKTSVSTNPVTFYNTAGLDRPIALEIQQMLKDRELSFGMHPEMEAKRREYLELLKKIGDPAKFDLQIPLFKRFEIFDAPGQNSNWEYTAGATVIQSNKVDNDKEGRYQNIGSLLVSRIQAQSGMDKVRLSFRAGSKGESGVVFNFKSNDDYWIASYSNEKEWNSLVIRRVLYGYSTEYGRGIKISDLTNLELEIEVIQEGEKDVLVSLFSYNDDARTQKKEIDTIPIRNLKLEESCRTGLYDQSNRDTEYFNLDMCQGEEKISLLPFFTDLDKLTDESYSQSFSVYNIDLRPNSWLATFKRLWAEKFFNKSKLDQAKTNYDNVFRTNPDSEDVLPNIEEIDNAEGRLRKAFDDYLRSQEKYQEFEAFMTGAGVSIPEVSSNSDFSTLFNITADDDSSKQIVQSLDIKMYNTWIEFYFTGSILDEVTGRVRYREIKVPHYRFVVTSKGDQYTYQRDLYTVEKKYWKTNYRSEVPDPTKVQTEIKLTSAQDVSETIRSIVSPESSVDENIEKDVREYKLIEDTFVDQYGVTLQDHVIRLTESPLKTVTNILVIPIYGEEDYKPDRMLVIKDPVFSGKQMHPLSVQFHEKYTMDIRWNGIGLGEFSHSVNLFPGEERELKIVTSKKRSWETVSKSKSSSKATSASESTMASKRNDSFSSKMSESVENSSSLSRSNKSNSRFKANVQARGSVGWFSASASVDYERASSSESNSKVSAVAKKASELASNSSAEVSQNNKVSFNSTTEMEQSLESKVSGEDMESETSTIRLSNINEGKTINYNFYQVTNVYDTGIRVENVTISIDTGIEIIPGTGITISKSFELEDFTEILSAFTVYDLSERMNIFKLIAAQVLLRYTHLPGDSRDDDPTILKIEARQEEIREIKKLRTQCKNAISKWNRSLLDNKETDSLASKLPDGLKSLVSLAYRVEGFETKAKNQFTVNSGKYYVDAHLGMMKATEEYLESRRAIETDRQKAIVEELKERTKKGVFFQELPDGVTNLSIEGN